MRDFTESDRLGIILGMCPWCMCLRGAMAIMLRSVLSPEIQGEFA